MNEIQKLTELIAARAPDAEIIIDAPGSASAAWWADVRSGEHRATIEWRPGRGFGVSDGNGAYGEGPDAVVTTSAEALDRVLTLIGAAPKHVLARR